jgi:hypothetical protein
MSLQVTVSLCNLSLGLPSDLFLTDIRINIISQAVLHLSFISNDFINLAVFDEVYKYFKTLNHEIFLNILLFPSLFSYGGTVTTETKCCLTFSYFLLFFQTQVSTMLPPVTSKCIFIIPSHIRRTHNDFYTQYIVKLRTSVYSALTSEPPNLGVSA